MFIGKLKQSVMSAMMLVDRYGNRVDPEIQEMVQNHFKTQERNDGPLSHDFLQGFFSGAVFSHLFLISKMGQNAWEVRVFVNVLIESARKYLDHCEQEVQSNVTRKIKRP